MTFTPLFLGTYQRLGRDYKSEEVRWRVVPVRYWYKKNRPQVRWVIFRCGERMWTKTSLPGALDYIRRHAR